MIQLILESSPLTIPHSRCTLEVTRLKSLVGFRKESSKDYLFVEGVLDTGGYVTVLPKHLAGKLELETVGHYTLSGVNPRRECAIPVAVAYSSCILFDEQGNRSKELRIPCYVSQTEEVPVILGFAGLLSEFEVCFDRRKPLAYLKE